MRLETHRRRDERRRKALRSVQRRVLQRRVDRAERAEDRLGVEYLDLPRPDDPRLTEAIRRFHFQQVDAVQKTGRVDVGDEAAEDGGREIGERVADVRTRVAVDRSLQDAAVDVDVDFRHPVRIRGPADHREGAGGVERAGEIGDVEAAERGLIERVVDRDRTPAEVVHHPAVAKEDLERDGVGAVAEATGGESGLEPGRDVLDPREVRIRQLDVDTGQSGVEVVLELVVDVELDLRDGRRIEHPALHQDHAELRRPGIGRVDRADDVSGLRGERRREKRKDRENQAAGNPSPHIPNLQPEMTLARRAL